MRWAHCAIALVITCFKVAASTNDFASYDEAIRTHPNDPQRYMDRAEAFVHRREWVRAIGDFDEAIRLDPENSLAYEARGCCHFSLGDLDKALNDLNETLRFSPANSRAYLNRGNLFRTKRDFDRALLDLTTALRFDATNSVAYGCRGAVYQEESAFQNAIRDFRRSVSLDPQNFSSLMALGWLQAACPVTWLRDGKAAIQTMQRACWMTGWANWRSLDLLAAAYAEAGDFKNAIEYEKQALDLTGLSEADRKEMQERLAFYENH